MSAFSARCRPRHRGLSSDDQEPPALPQTVPTDAASLCCTTTGSLQRVYGLSLRYKRTHKRINYGKRRGQFPRMPIGIRPPAGDAVRYAPRVCTLVLFIFLLFVTLKSSLICRNMHVACGAKIVVNRWADTQTKNCNPCYTSHPRLMDD